MMTVLRILLFVLPFLLGVLGAHFALYVTVVKFFHVTGTGPKLAVFLVPLFLTLGFFFANILLRIDRNWLFQGYGAASVVWLGLFINSLMGVGLIWLFFLVFKLSGRVPDMRIVCYAVLALAVLVTGYAIWNARRPVITRITVPMKNLPEQWRGKIVVQLSDVHLGVVRCAGYAREVVEQVNELKPSLVLITGDLFDGMSGRLHELIEPFNHIEAEHGVFFVTGNHEGYLGVDEPVAVIKKSRVRLLDNEVADIDGLQVVGLSFPEHDTGGGPLSIKGDIDPARPSILMYHTPSDVSGAAVDRGAQQNRTYFSPDTSFDFAIKHSIDLQLSGHTHQGQFFPFTLITHMIYGGYEYGLHRIGSFHIYTTSGTGTWGPPMRLASRSEIVAITLQ
jgi:predicted MPP superfamily phosphohydrolase